MKKLILSFVLLAMLPFLMGSISKEPEHTLLTIEEDFLTYTAPLQNLPTVTKFYSFRYIYDSDIDGNLIEQIGDAIRPDVNIWTHLAGVIPLDTNNIQAEVVVIPGQQTQAQALFNAIANNRPFRPFRLGNPGLVGRGGQRSSRYGGMWRYYIHVGRATLFRAYNITCNDNNTRVIGENGQPQRACDLLALANVRACIKMRVTGFPWNPDNPNL
jgi:hypothetical protein